MLKEEEEHDPENDPENTSMELIQARYEFPAYPLSTHPGLNHLKPAFLMLCPLTR